MYEINDVSGLQYFNTYLIGASYAKFENIHFVNFQNNLVELQLFWYVVAFL